VKLSGYHHGHIEVDGVEERRDLIIVGETVHRDWWRQKGHLLRLDDLGPVLDDPPDILVIGTGSMGVMRCEKGLAAALVERGITAEIMPTAKAAERFNELTRQGVNVAAALHLTC
jgi:hypothetical protein